MTSVQLLGMKHTGKSTLGRLLAQSRGLPFDDLDTLLEAELKGPVISAREIFRTLGKSRFQELEALAAKKAVTHLSVGSVLAWGGGTIDNSQAVATLKSQGTLVHLLEEPQILFERILQGGLPAFLSQEHPWDDFQALWMRRTQALSTICTIEIRLAGRPVEQIYQDLLNAV